MPLCIVVPRAYIFFGGSIMKEDILEQIVDDYLQANGYFTMHNLKFLPRRDHPDIVPKHDNNHSDIDVLGYNPKLSGSDRVMAVSCKSWQSGFRVDWKLGMLKSNPKQIVSGREAWKAFRELMEPRWSEAFMATVRNATNCAKFTYVTAVTMIKGDRKKWEEYEPFQSAMGGNPIRLLALNEMLDSITKKLSKTPANSEIGRLLQLMKASGYISIKLDEKPGDESLEPTSGRHNARYTVSINGEVETDIPKRLAALRIFTYLCKRKISGIAPESIQKELDEFGCTKRFYCVDGEVDSPEFIKRAKVKQEKEGRNFDENRWYDGENEHLIRFNGKTFAISNQWGRNFKAIQSLLEKHPEYNIRVEKNDD
jgi:hypothetical protein